MHVVIDPADPLIPLLEERAERRGMGQPSNRSRRHVRNRSLPKLARNLITERLRDLQEHGDPLEVKAT